MIVILSKEVQMFIRNGYSFHTKDEYIRPADVWYKSLGDDKFEIVRNNKELKDVNKDIVISSIKEL